MNEVIPNLFIGNWQEAKRFKDRHPTTLVLTCAKDSPWVGDFHFKLIDFNNSAENKKELLSAIKTLTYHHSPDKYCSDQPIFVHCISGITRCVTVVCGYLMKYNKFSLEDAHNSLKQRYPRTKDYTPSIKFLSMLLDL